MKKLNTCLECGKLIHPQAKRCRFCANSGSRNPMFGKRNKGRYKHGKSASKSYCVDCGKETSSYQHKRCWGCRNKYVGDLLRGENSPNWKGGIYYSKRGYTKEFTNELKNLIRERDNYKCQECGCLQIDCGRKLDVHHIDFNKTNCFLSNFVSLCRNCHMKTHHRREKNVC